MKPNKQRYTSTMTADKARYMAEVIDKIKRLSLAYKTNFEAAWRRWNHNE